MNSSYERDDLLHIMKMNRFALKEADSAQMSFIRQLGGKDYQLDILVIEDLPIVTISKTDI
jgi:hypothetical protein